MVHPNWTADRDEALKPPERKIPDYIPLDPQNPNYRMWRDNTEGFVTGHEFDGDVSIDEFRALFAKLDDSSQFFAAKGVHSIGIKNEVLRLGMFRCVDRSSIKEWITALSQESQKRIRVILADATL